MSNASVRYVVPYSAPGIKRGELRIDANSPTDAAARAQEIHASAVSLSRPGCGYRGPTPSTRWYYRPTMKLHKKERTQIVYGVPYIQA